MPDETPNMVDMALTPEERKASEPKVAESSEGEGPRYPWGLAIHLDDETLTKLGITELPTVGAGVTFRARAKVNNVSANETDEGGAKKVRRSVSLQVTAMGLDAGLPKRSAADTLYGDTAKE